MRFFAFFYCALLVGCGSKPDEPKAKSSSFAGLPGKWQRADSQGTLLEITKGGNIVLTVPGKKDVLAQSTVKGATLQMTEEAQGKFFSNWVKYSIEFPSDHEMLLVVDQSVPGVSDQLMKLGGRWQRVSVEQPGPFADAKGTVSKFEKKRLALAALLEKALGDRDELVAKLREAGVKTPADLKGNVRGQKLAGSLPRLSGEIDGLERQIAVLDTALLDARAVVRRLGREQAGISDEEMRKLAEQLREAEERMDGTPLPVTPLDVDAALEKALKARPKK